MTAVWCAVATVCVIAMLAGGLSLRLVRERDAAVRRLELRITEMEQAAAMSRRQLEAHQVLLKEAQAWIEAHKPKNEAE